MMLLNEAALLRVIQRCSFNAKANAAAAGDRDLGLIDPVHDLREGGRRARSKNGGRMGRRRRNGPQKHDADTIPSSRDPAARL